MQLRFYVVTAAILFSTGDLAIAAEPVAANLGMPFVRKYCVDCHGPSEPEGKLDLTRFADESAMLSARKVWSRALQNVQNREMPPPEAEQPSPTEREAFIAAVRGVFRKADAAGPLDPGRVVVRRLNRTEYNNTIRDLCMIEFEPAENFPEDDASDGFDNQSESLSLSPLLMERYLDAAEAVVTSTIATGEAREPKVRVGFTQFMVNGSRLPYRVLVFTSDPLVAEFRLAADGEYLLRIEGKPIGNGIRSAEVSLRVDGQQVDRLALAMPENGGTAKFEIPVKLKKGKRRVGLHLLNPAPELEAKKAAYPPRVDGKNDENYPGVELHRIDLVGPTDELPEGHRRIMACDPQTKPREQARKILVRFASRAFRRPAEADEVERYVKLFERASSAGQSFEAAIGIALQAILVSPSFLFRVELDDRPQVKEPHPISEYHLASRLSYFLWSSMPDEELLDLAAKGKLSKNLDAQVRRMLADTKSDALIENFTPQWLNITGIDRVTRGNQFDLRMREAMTCETLLFCEAVLRENRPITDFLDGRYTFINDRLARHYGLGQHAREKTSDAVIPAHAYVKVALPPDGIRAGILTHASVLTMTSPPDRTSPVKRGMWVLENILASPPPPPPPDVPALEQSAAENPEERISLRQRLEVHRSAAKCAGCHAKIDPLGFALEKFDNVGRYRERDDTKQPIDDLGELPGGRKISGAAGLREILLERKEQFARCLTEKMLAYALGRGVEEYDIPTVDAIVDSLRKDGYRFQTLVFEVAKSDAFRMRRGTTGDNP